MSSRRRSLFVATEGGLMPFTIHKQGPQASSQADDEETVIPAGLFTAQQVAPMSTETVLTQGRDGETGQYCEAQMHTARPAPVVDGRVGMVDLLDRAPEPAVSGSVSSALLGPIARSGAVEAGTAFERFQSTSVHPGGGE